MVWFQYYTQTKKYFGVCIAGYISAPVVFEVEATVPGEPDRRGRMGSMDLPDAVCAYPTYSTLWIIVMCGWWCIGLCLTADESAGIL